MHYLRKYVQVFFILLLYIYILPIVSAQTYQNISNPEVTPTPSKKTKTNNKDTTKKESITVQNSAKLSQFSLKAINLEIEKSSYGELLVWLQDLNLSYQGSKSELMQRLRKHYQIQEDKQEVSKQELAQEGVILTIDSADSLSSFTIKEYSEKYLRLNGKIRIILEDFKNNQKHTIQANEIILNRSTKSLTARGDIIYTLQHGNRNDVFYGDSITVNVNTWEGSFLGGITEMNPQSTGNDHFFFQGEVLSRSENNVVIFENVNIFPQKINNPYYSVKAQKLWILAENEWAVLNPVLKLGHIPVFYLPFYFQNGDRLFFQPAIGIHNTYGYFINTTTYLLGKSSQAAQTSISLLQITSQRSKEYKTIQGFFLKDPVKETWQNKAPRNWELVFMLDAYQKLGFYTALRGSLSQLGSSSKYPGLDPFTFRLGFAFSRILFQTTSGYQLLVPYKQKITDHWVSSYFLTQKIPFRYEAEFEMEWKYRGLQLGFSLNAYSDQYIIQEFHKRMENYNWDFIFSKQTSSSDSKTISSFQWYIVTAYTPQYKNLKLLKKYFSISMKRLNFSITFASKAMLTSELHPIFKQYATTYNNPEKYFFYPSRILMPDMQAEISGTLVDYRYLKNSDTSPSIQRKDLPNNPLSPPWKKEKTPNLPLKKEEVSLTLPSLPDFSEKVGISSTPFAISLTYRIDPILRVTMPTDSETWQTPKGISKNKWEKYLRLETLNKISLNSTLSFLSQRISIQNSLSSRVNFDILLQYNKSRLKEWEVDDLKKRFAHNTNQSISDQIKVTISPFLRNRILKNTSLSYTIDLLLFKRFFEKKQNNDIIFQINNFSWDEDFVKTHSLSANFNLSILDKTQSVYASITLPPNKSIDLSLGSTFNIGPVTATVQTKIKDILQDLSYDPLTIKSTYKWKDIITFSQKFLAEILEKKLTESYTTLGITIPFANITFSAGFTAKNIYKLEYDKQLFMWKETGNKKILPKKAQFDFNFNHTFDPVWKNRINISLLLGMSLSIDFQRFTHSSLEFRYKLNLAIYQSIKLSVGVKIRNDSLYRYFPSLSEKIGIKPRDFFKDIAYSLTLNSEKTLKKAFFKLQEVEINLSQDFGAWNFTFSYTGSPKLKDKVYSWNNTISFFVNWSLIQEFKTKIEMTEDTFTLEGTE